MIEETGVLVIGSLTLVYICLCLACAIKFHWIFTEDPMYPVGIELDDEV